MENLNSNIDRQLRTKIDMLHQNQLKSRIKRQLKNQMKNGKSQ